MKKAVFSISILAIAFFAVILTGCSSSKPGADDVAKVNGETITKQQLLAAVASVPFTAPNAQRQKFTDADKRKVALLDMIDRTLIEQQAEKNNITVSQREVAAEFQLYKGNRERKVFVEELKKMGMTESSILQGIHDRLLEAKVVAKLVKPRKVTEQEKKAAYEANKDKMYKGIQYEFAKGMIEQSLTIQKQKEARDAWLLQLKSESDIQLYRW